MRCALLFAGQGVAPTRQQVELAASTPAGLALLERAAQGAGLSSFEDAYARGGRALGATAVLQPVIVAVSLAIAMRIDHRARMIHLGHSLGEVAALASAGALDALAAIDLAAARGKAMALAAMARPGGLYAVRTEDVPRGLRLAGATAFVALDNAPDEVVLGADAGSLAALASHVPGRRLAVQGAWHGPAMELARPAFRQALDAAGLRSPKARVISCVDAEPIDTVERARTCLDVGLVKTVRFREALRNVLAEGVTTIVTVGPGAVLRALVRKNGGAERTVLTVEDDRELERALAHLGREALR